MSPSLETAALPEGLRRVAIDPVSRVEGHGKVTILLDAQNRVQQVRLHIVEFRGFEKFIEGRPYWEVPVMAERPMNSGSQAMPRREARSERLVAHVA